MGCAHKALAVVWEMHGWCSAYLDEGKAQNRSCDVTDPHACDHRDEHVGEEDGSRSRSGFAENESSHKLGYVVF